MDTDTLSGVELNGQIFSLEGTCPPLHRHLRKRGAALLGLRLSIFTAKSLYRTSTRPRAAESRISLGTLSLKRASRTRPTTPMRTAGHTRLPAAG